MKYISKTNVITMGGKTWWINARKSGVYTGMLKPMIKQIELMMEYHSKIHLIRFDLHQSIYTETNKRISIFNRRLFKWLKRHYKLKRIGYIWCREQEGAQQQHYHYVLIIDGHKVEKANYILNKVIEIWESMSGSCWVPKNCYYNLKYGQYREIQNAIFRVSYLAKARGKGRRPPQTKDYATSKIKPNDAKKQRKTVIPPVFRTKKFGGDLCQEVVSMDIAEQETIQRSIAEYRPLHLNHC